MDCCTMPTKTIKKIFTLIFVQQDNQVLLGYKTRGLGVNLWNGFGGKVEENESLIEGALRELKEESHISAEIKHIATATYVQEGVPLENVVHIFKGTNYKGDIQISDEMNPIKWFDYDAIPYDKMWPDAKDWLPQFLSSTNKYFQVKVIYKGDKIKDFLLTEHNSLQLLMQALEL